LPRKKIINVAIWMGAMNSLVVYFSRGGNTRKVAEAIANELGCNAVDIMKERPNISNIDLLIVGSGTYGAKPGKEFMSFIEEIPQTTGKRAALFATCSSGVVLWFDSIKGLLESKGYQICGSFQCFGQIYFVRRGHPTSEELASAANFAIQLKSEAIT
jgi:flavodoxin